jgi:hypothetical protein
VTLVIWRLHLVQNNPNSFTKRPFVLYVREKAGALKTGTMGLSRMEIANWGGQINVRLSKQDKPCPVNLWYRLAHNCPVHYSSENLRYK